MALNEIKFEASQLNDLFAILKSQGYTLIGPTKEGQAITYNTLEEACDLPIGWQDIQRPGYYRLQKRKDSAYFGYNIGSRSFKQYLFPPKQKLYEVNLETKAQVITPKKKQKLALIGVRACEIQAILIQDKVFTKGPFQDLHYQAIREEALIVGLNCHTTTETCFCVSMQTGPEVTQGYDLVLSELIEDKAHFFLCRAGSDKGLAIINQMPNKAPDESDLNKERAMIIQTSQRMGRQLKTDNIKQTLYDAHQSSRWETIAQTCINCGNCTMACPTCFCSTHEHESNLEQTQASVTREWESCFSQNHSYVHDAFVRDSASSRYRQWMTHKLASWHDQFDTSGCVGCGRCLTWCPVGIDLTEEATLIMQEQAHENN